MILASTGRRPAALAHVSLLTVFLACSHAFGSLHCPTLDPDRSADNDAGASAKSHAYQDALLHRELPSTAAPTPPPEAFDWRSAEFATDRVLVRFRQGFVEQVAPVTGRLSLDRETFLKTGGGFDQLRAAHDVERLFADHDVRRIEPLRDGADDPQRTFTHLTERLPLHRQALLERNRDEIVRLARELDRVHVLTFDNPEADAELARARTLEMLKGLREDPDIESVSLDFVVRAHATSTPDDPYFWSTNSWNQGTDDHPVADLWGLKRIKAPAGWEQYPVTDGEPIVVAVLDTGIDFLHRDMFENSVYEIPDHCTNDDGNAYLGDIYGWNFTNGKAMEKSEDWTGHGTHVAGTIAAGVNNGRGIAGVSPHAQIMGVKVLGDDATGGFSWIAQGIVYAAENGADVINMSLGTTGWVPRNQTLVDAVDYATALGVLVIASAGNDGIDIGTEAFGVMPAAIDNVMAVGATDENDERLGFSNGGQGLSVSAPGGGSQNPNVAVPWAAILSARSRLAFDQQDWEPFLVGDRGRYLRLGGTSMAAPHVAGLAAYLLARTPELNPHLLRLAIEGGADDLGVPGFDGLVGFGRINFQGSLTRLQQMIATPRAELILDRLEAPDEVLVTHPFALELTLLNEGLAPATGVSVKVLVDGELVQEFFIDTLGLNERRELSVPMTLAALGRHEISVVVNDPIGGTPVGEYFVRNNSRQVWLRSQKARFPARELSESYSVRREDPAACGSRLVWTERPDEMSAYIVSYDLAALAAADGETDPAAGFTYIDLAGRDLEPTCSADRIAWVEEQAYQWRWLHVRRHDSDVTRLVEDAGFPLRPELDGSLLVWLDYTGPTIKLLDFKEPAHGGSPGALPASQSLVGGVDSRSFPRLSSYTGPRNETVRTLVWAEGSEDEDGVVYRARFSLPRDRPGGAPRQGAAAPVAPVIERLTLPGDNARQPDVDGETVVYVAGHDRRDSVYVWAPYLDEPLLIAETREIGNRWHDYTENRSPRIVGNTIVYTTYFRDGTTGQVVESQIWIDDAGPDGRWGSSDDYGKFLIEGSYFGGYRDPAVLDDWVVTIQDEPVPSSLMAYRYVRAFDYIKAVPPGDRAVGREKLVPQNRRELRGR